MCPKTSWSVSGKGTCTVIGRTKKDVVGNWPDAHAEVEAILDGAQASAEKYSELIKRKDTEPLFHLVEEKYGKKQHSASRLVL